MFEATKFNIILNGKTNIKPILGNLYDGITSHNFDVITANPPFIPVPDGYEFPIAGGGGVDGLKVINDILEGIPLFLNEGGTAIICGEAIGNNKTPFLVSSINKYLPSNFKVNLFLHHQIDICKLASNMVKICNNITNIDSKFKYYETWNEFYKGLNCTHYYVFSLIAIKTNIPHTVIDIINENESQLELNYIPVCSLKYTSSVEQVIKIEFENGRYTLIDNSLYKLLELIDGVHNIYWVIDKFLSMNMLYDKDNLYNAQIEVLNMIKMLKDKGFIQIIK
ncbi:hypothetical protein KYB31_06820 [Clostridium felsineum]|uniref:hypothetical protein n=1 Tax=Clostridium felsineum TaxID=36839 RepID=UPI00214D8F4B|nr:hypothetical protein [Clostridium felsineum]MCR3758707.1 hypothetical protein [Clostridium felsineum]